MLDHCEVCGAPASALLVNDCEEHGREELTVCDVHLAAWTAPAIARLLAARHGDFTERHGERDGGLIMAAMMANVAMGDGAAMFTDYSPEEEASMLVLSRIIVGDIEPEDFGR